MILESTATMRGPRSSLLHAFVFLAAAGLGSGCGGPAPSPRPADSASPPPPPPERELAYVTNEDTGSLSVISTATDRVIAEIPVGRRPRGVKLSPDGRTVYVALSGSPKCPPSVPDEECAKRKADKSHDGIAIVDAAARRLTRVLPGGSDPEQFDVSADGSRLYVSNEDMSVASIVDVASGRVLQTVAVGGEPEGVRRSPDGKLVYVTGEADADVTVIDTATGRVLGRIGVGHRPRDAIFSADGATAYVSSELDGIVVVVDVARRKVTDRIVLPKGSRSMGLALSPDGTSLYVTNGRAQTVSQIELPSHRVVRSVEVGPRPWGIAVTGDGKHLYVANGPSNDVTVVDTATFSVKGRIAVGESPWGVVIGSAPGAR